MTRRLHSEEPVAREDTHRTVMGQPWFREPSRELIGTLGIRTAERGTRGLTVSVNG
jgi:hypothetical protein